MGKITVKHYLNTNLKSYKINGEDYYSIYILVSANRQNTKVKSIKFNELYTERDYAELIQENNPNLNIEISAIVNISTVMISVLGVFDTSFFTLLYTFSDGLFINKIIGETNYVSVNTCGEEYVFNLKNKEENKLNVSINDLLGRKQLKVDNTDNISILYWYSDRLQNELVKYLKGSKSKFSVSEIRDSINLLIFYSYLNALVELIPKKYEIIYVKYKSIFNNYKIVLDEITINFGKNQKKIKFF